MTFGGIHRHLLQMSFSEILSLHNKCLSASAIGEEEARSLIQIHFMKYSHYP